MSDRRDSGLGPGQDELEDANQELVKKARLAAIEELSGVLAHAIRNPLAGIRAAAQLASFQLREHPAGSTVADVVSEVDRLDARIGALLDFSRPFHPDVKVVSLSEVARQAVRDMSPRAVERNVQIVLQPSDPLPDLLLDPALFERAAAELISNAIDASPDGGEVIVATGLGEETGGPAVWLEVRDTGAGIALERLEQLFDLFYTTKPRGTGFGLVTVRKIAEAHGGRVFANNLDAGGACFRIVIPRRGREPGSA